MTKTIRSAALIACIASGTQCASPAPTQTVTATPETAAPTAPEPDPGIARADALLADMRRRETALREYERTAPPPPPAPRLEDFLPSQSAPAPTPYQPVGVATAAPTITVESSAAPRLEEHWKNRMRELRARLDADGLALASARVQLRDVERYIRADGSMPPVVADNVFAARARVTELAAAIVFDEGQIANLEEEARRANVPSGWLRP